MENPYQHSDKAIALLNRKAIRRFEDARKQAALLKFDELNVIRICKELYTNLAADNRNAFLDLAALVYLDAKPHGKEIGDTLLDLWLYENVLSKPNDVTHYTYTNEVERKRERLAEAVNSSPITQKRLEFQKGLRYWSQMTGEYADIITYETTLKAFQDAGVKKVRWRTENDGKVCKVCGPRDGKVYDIDKVPPKPHWGCRCWLEEERV